MISNKLKELMEEHDITINELADKTGITYITLWTYIKNTRIPSLYNANLLANYFNIKVDDLIDKEN